MIYLSIIFFSSVILSTGLILSRKSFFKLAENTLGLLNTLLDSNEDELIKQKALIRGLTKLLSSLFKFILFIGLTVALAVLPTLAFISFDTSAFKDLDFRSVGFYAVLIIGSLVPFVIFSFQKPKGDYSEWSVLLHKIILNNYNISKYLFSVEKGLFRRKTRELKNDFWIISGLARSGTTALTTLLFRSDKFHSLSYANVPFLLTPNLWRLFYRPSNARLKERSHGDKVMIGHNTVEALEEFFFKAFLLDSFVKKDTLIAHDIDDDTYRNYLIYQNLLKPSRKPDSTYIAKNNNFLLRYQSIRKFNPDFKVFFLFRDPVNHAHSLLKQHQRFSKFQKEDPFTLEYMNWLGHHEFGLNLKSFKFPSSKITDDHPPESINYWLISWINYYSHILEIMHDENVFLIHYSDFLQTPEKLIASLSAITNLKINIDQIAPFKNTNHYSGEVDIGLQDQAQAIFNQLVARKVVV
ncbi:sulfotransferase [Fulvivirgaceae bacterium BMA12]|uniref:Sulfotransferase n=1 Tax=Agaribacillus aureus TaxID=3051825 RepID=A0ABT8LI26_9BACT|nr:sulfotransferase [Fulvivirgaceae bacterium BMA12]